MSLFDALEGRGLRIWEVKDFTRNTIVKNL